MKVLFVFINVGYYHIARINSLSGTNLNIQVLQLTNNTLEHPWGETDQMLKFPLHTLIKDKNTGMTNIPKVDFSYLNSFLSDIKPDVIFIPGWGFDFSSKLLKWGKLNNVKCILMSESKYDDKKRYKLIEYYKSIKYISKFQGAIVGGKDHAQYLISLGMKRENIKVGYDMVDNVYFSEMTRKIRSSDIRNRNQDILIPKNDYFLCVTRFLPRKNIKLLVEAYVIYRKSVASPWDLVICGTGQEFGNIRNLINVLELNKNVHLPGFVTYSNIIYWYAYASCLVHPASSEQWGLVVNEACASNLPIICSKKVGACSELVFDDVNGFKFNPDNCFELANQLNKIHNLGKEKLINMGNNSFKLVSDKCSSENFKESCLQLINI